MIENLLSARGARRFLTEYWQKKPGLVRGQVPEIDASVDRKRLIGLACRDDVESRIVTRTRTNWQVRYGPFRQRDFAQLPPRNWTLLVYGVENVVPAARAMQMKFGFVPYARHDDVMISYAAPGGGVGPHYDSYDVFLLQAAGSRRWQISGQADLGLVEGAPLRILSRFRPGREWVLRRGDLLYLPPNYAHHGVALEECITWSVGLRAPSQQEIAVRFLDYLQDRLALTGNYRDPALMPQRHPAAISTAMLRQVKDMLAAVRWDDTDIARCVGEYLTEPRPNIVFDHAGRMPAARFARAVKAHGVNLNLKSRMLLGARMIFINGESVAASARTCELLLQLADQRSLRPGLGLNGATRELIYRWYRAGYVDVVER